MVRAGKKEERGERNEVKIIKICCSFVSADLPDEQPKGLGLNQDSPLLFHSSALSGCLGQGGRAAGKRTTVGLNPLVGLFLLSGASSRRIASSLLSHWAGLRLLVGSSVLGFT